MAAQSSNESTLPIDVTTADRAVQAAPSTASQTTTPAEAPAGRMRLDMNEILGLKRG